MDVERIKKIGPSFKADDEHFHVFVLNNGRCVLVTGNISWKADQFVDKLPAGATWHDCDNLSVAKDKWHKCADVLEDSGLLVLANQMRKAWDTSEWESGNGRPRRRPYEMT